MFAPTTDPDALRAAHAAADAVPDRSVLGLGSGTTFAAVLERLALRISTGLRVSGVPTSQATADAARAAGVRLVEPQPLALAVDGADEVDPEGNLLKGGGGALLREKLVALAADRLWIVVTPRKLVTRLGETFPLPIEIVPFGHALTLERIQRLLPVAALRMRDGDPFVTDNGNYLVDATLPRAGDARLHDALKSLVGVVETGLFVNLPPRTIWWGRDGGVEKREHE